jgi:uncharacterized membrane protein YqjE
MAGSPSQAHAAGAPSTTRAAGAPSSARPDGASPQARTDGAATHARAGAASAARADGARGAESLIDLARGLLHDLPGLIGDRVELFSLELHRAGIALVKVLTLVLAATILGVTAWLAVWSIGVGLLMAAGWHWAAANGLVALINALAAVWAVRRVRAQMKLLSLPATRQHLMLGTGSIGAAAESQASRSAPDERAVGEHPAAA